MYRKGGGASGRVMGGDPSVAVMLVCDPLIFFDLIGRRIPPPQPNNFVPHCGQLLLVKTEWHNSAQSRKVMDKRERYGEKGIDDWKVVLTGWVIDTRTVLREECFIYTILGPADRMKVACRVPAMLGDYSTAKYLNFW